MRKLTFVEKFTEDTWMECFAVAIFLGPLFWLFGEIHTGYTLAVCFARCFLVQFLLNVIRPQYGD
jgi:hypothetical protein